MPVVFAWMYASNRDTTAVTRAFTFATFASTVANISSSFGTCYCGALVVAASASVSYLFLTSRVATWLLKDFTRFCNAFARERAAEPDR
jgi:hypothetical protein